MKAAYQQAVEDRADRLAEELMELADTPIPEGLDCPGRSVWMAADAPAVTSLLSANEERPLPPLATALG